MQFRTAAVPIVDADVSIPPAVLHTHRRPDPLATRELLRGDFNLGILIAGERPSGPDITGEPASAGHSVRRDRQSSVADTGPIRTQAAGWPVEIIRGMCRYSGRCGCGSFVRKHRQRRRRQQTASRPTSQRALSIEFLARALVISPTNLWCVRSAATAMPAIACLLSLTPSHSKPNQGRIQWTRPGQPVSPGKPWPGIVRGEPLVRGRQHVG